MKTITLILFLLVIVLPASAKQCTTMEAFAAESVMDYLDSWREVYNAFKQFGYCDDGAIAEGFDDVISKLWAENWNSLPEMIKCMRKDNDFKKFVEKRIGSEVIPFDRWVTIVSNAKSHCPDAAKEFCQRIIKTK
jgi:hypothetical protein